MTTFINYMRTLDFDTIKTLADGEYELVTYYVDAIQIYDKYRDELWELLCETTEDACPGLTPISAMNFSRASSHEMFITDFVNYIAMLVAQKIIEEIKNSKNLDHIRWVEKNYPEERNIFFDLACELKNFDNKEKIIEFLSENFSSEQIRKYKEEFLNLMEKLK